MHNFNFNIHGGIYLPSVATKYSSFVSTILCLYQHFFNVSIVVASELYPGVCTVHVESTDGGSKCFMIAYFNDMYKPLVLLQ